MQSSYPGSVEGVNLRLRFVEPEDATYIHSLRVDPAYNAHLSEVQGGVEAQRRWIETYKEREAAGHEFYFIIERKDAVRCGTVRLYDIDEHKFTWGSWILDGNKPPKAAPESAILSLGIGFDMLTCSVAHINVDIANRRAIDFYHRFGMRQVRESDDELFFEYSTDDYRTHRPLYLDLLKGRAPW